MKKDKFLIWLVFIFFVVLMWSLINPADMLTWWLEVAPALIGFVILAITYKKFRLTNLVYALIFFHAVILMIGGHYTYAKMPVFSRLQDIFHLKRNHYDRLGHFVQGFVPAMIARELLLRKTPLKPGKWLTFIILSICLAISASYELIEWMVSMITGSAADAFLGTQGDIWDTQWDMTFALIGAFWALILLNKWHNEQLQKMQQLK